MVSGGVSPKAQSGGGPFSSKPQSGGGGWAAAASGVVYAAVAAFFGRDLLFNLSTMIAGDEGDPLFVAAILHWNATTVPLSGAWWQFPIFEPTRDTLTFSEHFLGLLPITTPLHWMTGDAVVTYNLVTLLTFPLCGLAMFALAHRITRSGAGAFLAGLAFAFAPYRFSQLPHLQMLAFFWAPLALLGLHAYVETRHRRWLLLYGASWMLQAATNWYALVFLSVVVGFWVVWFVVAPRKWSALAAIAAATLIAVLPLAPIVAKYMSVHALHGFARDPGEIRSYSADLAAVLCAPVHLTLWGWLQAACRPEGELFPGVGVAILSLVAVFHVASRSTSETRTSRMLTTGSRILLVSGLVFAAAACSVIVAGPWAFTLGPLRISASSIAKPVMLATATSLLGLAMSPGIRAAARGSSTSGFYLVAALLTWLLALGPTLTFMGEPRGFQAPFALLMYLPGVEGLRVPARFWLLTTMCLAMLVGLLAASLLQGRRRLTVAAGTIVASALLLSDGWVNRIPAAPIPQAVPDARALRGGTVLTLPMGPVRDIAAEFRGVTGGWRSINGYSGYFPRYYVALADAARDEEEAVVVPFLARGDLHVILTEEARRLRDMIERQPGAVMTAAREGVIQYRIPRRAALPRWDDKGERLPIQRLTASCEMLAVPRAADGDERTRWECGPQRPGHEIEIDLGRSLPVSAVVQNLAEYNTNYPRHLLLETSVDGASWVAAWDGSVRSLLIAQTIERPGPWVSVTVPFPARQARYIRLRQMAADQLLPWSIAELEVWSGR
jgi:hypothetical protein